MRINIQPFNKSMGKIIEYMKKLEGLDATSKLPSTRKHENYGSEDKNGKSKNKTNKCSKKNLSLKVRIGRRLSMILRMTSSINTVQSIMLKVGHSRLTIPRIVEP